MLVQFDITEPYLLGFFLKQNATKIKTFLREVWFSTVVFSEYVSILRNLLSGLTSKLLI